MSARGDDEIRADLAKRYDLGSRKGDWFERMARLADDVPGLLGQRDEARAALAAVREAATVAFKGPNDTDATYLLSAAERIEGGYAVGGSNVTATVIRTLRAVAALAADGVPEPPTEQRFLCGECGHVWPMGLCGPPTHDQRHSWLGDSDCPGLFSLVPHHPTPCYCASYGVRRCPQHAGAGVPEPPQEPQR